MLLLYRPPVGEYVDSIPDEEPSVYAWDINEDDAAKRPANVYVFPPTVVSEED